MSTDNVTSTSSGDSPPPKPARTPKKDRRPKQQRVEISFGWFGEGPDSLTIWQGLRGVCVAMNEVGGLIGHETTNQFGNLSAAALVLSDLLEDRLMLRND
jgi:hypothetical protein